jgi:hypothetical protein
MDTNTLFESIIETQMDYSIPVFTGSHNKPTNPFKRNLTRDLMTDPDAGLEEEKKTSTERVRRYYRRNRKKVREYLKKTQDERVARNRDRKKAIKKYGKKKMNNHDVHHPNGAKNGNWRLARKDHGRDKLNEVIGVDQLQPFVTYAAKRLQMQNIPHIAVVPVDPNVKSLGWYNIQDNTISVITNGRLLADVLRTIAHELAHHKQLELGQSLDGTTGSSTENAANIIAGILMREYGKIDDQIYLIEQMLNEGGAAGHLAHPFEDEDLTFADMKEMITRGLQGGLDAEGPVTEKLDGQNIAFSIKDGRIIFARNKGHLKNRGKNSLDVAGIKQLFAGRGNIEKAFGSAAEDLQAAAEKLSPEQVEQMFGDGSKFMSLEVILPDTQNVIPYGKNVLIMHGTIEYNEDGEEIARNNEDGRTFASAVTAAGADKQKTYGIEGPRTMAFSDAESDKYQQKTEQYLEKLTRTAKTLGLKDAATLGEYRRKWWEQHIKNTILPAGIALPPKEIKGLVARWADGDKKFGVKDIQDPETKAWFRQFEKEELLKTQKQMIRPIEMTFLQAGTDALRRVTNFLSANNPEASAQLKKDALQAIKAIQDSDEPDKIAKLQRELERLEGMGIDDIVPSEGVVFMYNGKPYKFTGQFAPINQITGTFKFGLAPKEPTQAKEEPEKKATDIQDVAAKLNFKPTSKQPKQYTQANDVGDASDLSGLPKMSFAKNTVSGMRVVTTTADGKETENTAEVGDIIMTGPSGEQYVVKAAKFDKLYTDGPDGTKIPEQSPRQVAVYDGKEEISFTAPWGESMVLKPGDYVVKDGEGYYRIAKKEYEQTYNPPGVTKAKPTQDVPARDDTPDEPESLPQTIAIFTGRFQPFHSGHYSIYQAMVERFGKDNVYIASSDKQEAIKSPFPFKDKKDIMTRMFDIPEDKVVQVKNPYAPAEILEKLPPNTRYVTAVSQKDAERLSKSKYFRNLDDTPEDEQQGYADQGYFMVAPEMQLMVNGKNISGTQLRAVMGDPNITDRAKQEIFTKVYGKFDKKIFDKIVKTTTEAEEAKALTAQHAGTPEKTPRKKKADAPDPEATQRVKKLLRQRIMNPDTKREIFVGTALGYPPEARVRKAAEAFIKSALGKRKKPVKEVLVEEKTSDELKVYTYTRDYTDAELNRDVEEYFDNEITHKAFPGLADSAEELIQLINDAPEVVMSRKELEKLENSEVGEVLTANDATAVLKKIQSSYGRDVTGIAKDMKTKSKFALPVVIKYDDGHYLMSGNTRLSVLASIGYTIPVKMITFAGTKGVPGHATGADTRDTKTHKKSKEKLFKDLMNLRITNPETGNEIKIDTAMDYNKNHPAHTLALNIVRQRMKGISTRAGVPKP